MDNAARAKVRSAPKGPPRGQGRTALFRNATTNIQFAPRGQGYYDAFANAPSEAVVASAIGPCTPVCGYSVDSIPSKEAVPISNTSKDTQNNELALLNTEHKSSWETSSTLILFNPGASDAEIATIHDIVAATGGDVTVRKRSVLCTQLLEFGPARGNSSGQFTDHVDGDGVAQDSNPTRRICNLPLRGSIRIRNTTEGLNVGGVVRVLRLNAGIRLNEDLAGDTDRQDGNPTTTGYLNVCSMIRDSVRSKTFTGHELKASHQMNSYPVDFIKCMSFREDVTLNETISQPAFCTIAILIDNFLPSGTGARNNSYEITCQVHRAARYDPSSILGSLQRSLRTATDAVAAMTSKEEQKAPAHRTPEAYGARAPHWGA